MGLCRLHRDLDEEMPRCVQGTADEWCVGCQAYARGFAEAERIASIQIEKERQARREEIEQLWAKNAQLWKALTGGDHPSECQCNDCYSRKRVQELRAGDKSHE